MVPVGRPKTNEKSQVENRHCRRKKIKLHLAMPMDNLHDRLNFNLSKEKGIKHNS
jgi:hypothetical protein